MATVQRAKTPVAPMPMTAGKTNGGSSMPAASTSTATAAPGKDPIAQRAYEIWQESGCPHGKDQEHWFRAEREIRAKTTVRR